MRNCHLRHCGSKENDVPKISNMIFLTMQISMNVQQTTEVVALTPPALTLVEVSCVLVYLDTPEMDLPVQVS